MAGLDEQVTNRPTLVVYNKVRDVPDPFFAGRTFYITIELYYRVIWLYILMCVIATRTR
jgi:hypothetical protein